MEPKAPGPLMKSLPTNASSSGNAPHLFSAGLPTRRDVLRVGAVSLAATAVPASLLAAQRSSAARGSARAESVIVLWMAGGVTHIDSFDPKPHAREEIRGTLTDIATKLPGVRFCETLPELAKIADKLAVLRSYSHGSNDHLLSQVHTLSGRVVTRNQLFSEPNMGAIVSSLLGPRNNLPGYIAVPGITRPGPPPHNLFVGGWMGSMHGPYCVGGQPDEPDFTAVEQSENPSPRADENRVPRDLARTGEMPLARISRRQELRRQLDGALSKLEQLDALAAQEEYYRSALRLLTSPGIRDAFDVTKEPERVRAAYGHTKIGSRCLLARRLVEAGARYVMVDYGYDPDYGNLWDNHCAPSQKQPHISVMCQRGYHVRGMDQAFAGLISDLDERGLLDSTLVVFLTEFGRTPKINQRGGRDHWGPAGSLFFTGAGTKTGQVVGATDKHAAHPTTPSYGPSDVAATIYHALGIDPGGMVYDFQGRPRPILEEGEVIREVV